MGSHINLPGNVDFIEVCGDKIIRERVVCKSMGEIYKAKGRDVENRNTARIERLSRF